jgi:5-formyltetrahydrofolate cyclo-ligase
VTADLPAGPASESWEDIRAWRKALRGALIDRRMGLASHVRLARGDQAKGRLAENIDLPRAGVLGIYWPIRGEIDARDIARSHAGFARIALPVVVERSQPVEFWAWRPGMRMTRGLWDIPIPAEREAVIPDTLIVPLVGFDAGGYRLGYGGGYYDRTLAAAPVKPFCIGLGYEDFALASIHPQRHDIPMDVIVTDRSVTWCESPPGARPPQTVSDRSKFPPAQA